MHVLLPVMAALYCWPGATLTRWNYPVSWLPGREMPRACSSFKHLPLKAMELSASTTQEQYLPMRTQKHTPVFVGQTPQKWLVISLAFVWRCLFERFLNRSESPAVLHECPSLSFFWVAGTQKIRHPKITSNLWRSEWQRQSFKE